MNNGKLREESDGSAIHLVFPRNIQVKGYYIQSPPRGEFISIFFIFLHAMEFAYYIFQFIFPWKTKNIII